MYAAWQVEELTKRAEVAERYARAWKALAKRLRLRAMGTPDYQTACRLGVELLEENDTLKEINSDLNDGCVAYEKRIATLEADLQEARRRVP